MCLRLVLFQSSSRLKEYSIKGWIINRRETNIFEAPLDRDVIYSAFKVRDLQNRSRAERGRYQRRDI